jgi:hypothetical protein
MLTIGFMTTLGVNVGDEFIREGIRASLEQAGIAYTPLYINKHDERSLHEPREDETLVVADKFWASDVFIQSGSPVYWWLQHGVHTSLTSEWHKWMWEERILHAEKKGPLFLNLGAGSCQPWGEGPEEFLADEGCAKFARMAGNRAALTSVRDPVASEILRKVDVAHEALPCPAFLAGARHRIAARNGNVIGLNLMPNAGHFDLRNNFDRQRWVAECGEICRRLRALGRLVFIAHDKIEQEFMQSFAGPGERVALGSAWREYLDLYAGCAAVVANRVHGAVCAGGLGVPSLIIGTDTRARIGEYVGLDVTGASVVTASAIEERVSQILRKRNDEQERLLAHRDATLKHYAGLLSKTLADVRK